MMVVIPMDTPVEHGENLSGAIHNPWQHPATKGQAKKSTTDGEEWQDKQLVYHFSLPVLNVEWRRFPAGGNGE